MYRKLLLLPLFIAFFLNHVNAQQVAKEIGVTGGLSYYIGDLNPYTHYRKSKLAGGAFYRHPFNKRFVLRTGINYLRVEGDDSDATSVNQRNRNLHFKSSIIEVASVVEFNFREYDLGKSDKHPFSPYIFAGLAYFRMNPKAQHNDEWTELQPLGTEGQETSANSNKKYKLDQLSLPVGLGIKVSLSDFVALSFEYGIRKTFTDYLDDVSGDYADPDILVAESGPLAADLADQSQVQEGANGTNTGIQRGNSNNKDWYSFTGISLSFRFNAQKCATPY
jgi:hypothetical protein